MAMDAAGNAIAVWESDSAQQSTMWASRYEAGAGWSTAELIEQNDVGGVTCPDVGMDAAGNGIAIWSQNYNGIYVNRYAAGAGWGTAQRIDDATGSMGYPQIAVSADGNAFAVWVQWNSGAYSIWVSRYVAGSGWGTAEIIQSNAGDSAY